ncbi:TIGR04222 domain-containing membrane protein [Neorhodopirellula pilleata]|uniref:TIGR04222 domain-containing membrane protein n=1 Tax=Neorhodopirellula pilleata TaxID=2714738 RepID=A0A5C6A697_9BACT|nr:TIGR04222 domain-containing membrane protein [Neorhodopirellula pilleata]TWT94976.1 hypothetical protein Pla100_35550 [Neorhodopirellula pilleata]
MNALVNKSEITQPENDVLWKTLSDFPIGGESASWEQAGTPGGLTFSMRLARENGWSLDHARHCIDEYRRFLYLAARAGHSVTPSDAVDQVWHQHLVYTENYWVDLCGEVLPTPLHHGPTRGGTQQRVHFQDQYEKTLRSYERFFGKPPKTIWPATQERFAQSIASVRVDRRKAWIIPKPNLSLTMPGGSRYSLAGLATIPLATMFPFNLDGPTFLAVYGLIVALACIFCFVWYHVGNGFLASNNAQIGSDCRMDWCLTALLAGGRKRLLQVALLELVRRENLRCDGNGFVLANDASYQPLPNDGELARSLFQAITQTVRASGKPQSVKRLSVATNSVATRGELQLQASGYLRQSDQNLFYRSSVMSVAAVVLGIGGIRCYQGIATDRPIGFLILEMVMAIVLFAMVFRLDGRLTTKGAGLLDQLRAQYPPSHVRSTSAENVDSDEMLPYLAFLGPAAIASLTHRSADMVVHDVLFGEEIRARQREASSTGGAWDFGSDSGDTASFSSGADAGCGSGCGGGCGGCGG